MKKDILANPANVAFKDLFEICRKYFGEPRIKGSHHIFKTPWQGNPRINIQKDGKWRNNGAEGIGKTGGTRR